MGLLIDTNVLIAFERKRLTASSMLQTLQASFGNRRLAASSISVLEFSHGMARAKNEDLVTRRRNFLDGMYLYLDMIPVSSEIAERAGIMKASLQCADWPLTWQIYLSA